MRRSQRIQNDPSRTKQQKTTRTTTPAPSPSTPKMTTTETETKVKREPAQQPPPPPLPAPPKNQTTTPSTSATFQGVLDLPGVKPAPPQEKPKKSYTCRHCATTFRRNEHCVRHERSHTLEKPFACRFCKCHFSRRDLLLRHERTVHSETERPVKRQRRHMPCPERQMEMAAQAQAAQNNPPPAAAPAAIPSPKEPSPLHFAASSPLTGVDNPNLWTGLDENQDLFNCFSPESTLPSDRRSSIFTNVSNGHPLTPNSLGSTENPGPHQQHEHGDLRIQIPEATPPELLVLTEINEMNPAFAALPMHNASPHHHHQQQQHAFMHSNPPTTAPGLMTDFLNDNVLGWLTEDHRQPPRIDAAYPPIFLPEHTASPSLDDLFPTPPTTATSTSRGRRLTDSSQETLGHSPSFLGGQSSSSSVVVFTESNRTLLQRDLELTLPHQVLSDFCLPSCSLLQRYLDSYFSSFHRLLPILHVPTFERYLDSSILVLAVCCVGAQQCLEKRRARCLFDWARRFLSFKEKRLKACDAVGKEIVVKARLLVAAYAVWSAEEELVVEALAEVGWLGAYFRQLQDHSLCVSKKKVRHGGSWQDWVDRESTKRLCFGIFIFQSTLTTAFNIPPLLSTSEVTLDLPCPGELWEAVSEEHWASLATITTNSSFQSSLKALHNENAPMKPFCEPFAGLVLVHAILLQLWQLSQCSGDTDGILAVANRLLAQDQNMSSSSSLRAITHGLLNLAVIQSQPQAPPKGIVRPHDAAVDIQQVVDYAVSPCQRGPMTTVAVGQVLHYFQMGQEGWTGVEVGLVVYHAVLFLTRWLVTMECEGGEWGEDERDVYESVASAMGTTTDGGLAVKVLERYAGLLGGGEEWVWRVTAVVGGIFSQVAEEVKARR